MADDSILGAFDKAVREHLTRVGRDMLVKVITPLFATAEQRDYAQARVDAMTDEEIDKVWRNYAEAESKRCPECGRPYDDDE